NWKMCLECYNFELLISMVNLLTDIFAKVRCSLAERPEEVIRKKDVRLSFIEFIGLENILKAIL
ncbi:hypothetical protein, partial [Nostoc sp.]|uniref:hypothetical protein n=1 Tax=Nostoc sp. TaxID=1180 RepID=UPI002FFAC1F0